MNSRVGRTWALAMIGAITVACAAPAAFGQDGFRFEDRLDGLYLLRNGAVWLSTVPAAFNPADGEARNATYKVYTHIYSFQGTAPITKGLGGLYPHHRGLFIGWKDTLVGGHDYDTWHMPECNQQHVAWLRRDVLEDRAVQSEEISWQPDGGAPFIREIRTISAQEDSGGARVFDFQSTLTSLQGTIELKGDSHHGGMQVRLDNEVADHPDTTEYILPAAAVRREKDEVVGAWWACCSAMIRGARYWVLHMTPRDLPGPDPIYSIRPYGRFGAFFERSLEEGKAVPLHFRIIVSEKPLDRDACAAFYQTYNEGRAQPAKESLAK